MKSILLTLVLIFPVIAAFAQTDSTTIYYRGIDNDNIRTICNLSDIQIEKIFCKDTLLRGKVFNVIIKEFKKGKIRSVKNLNIDKLIERYKMINITDKVGFGNSTDSLTLSFAGILKEKIFKLKIDYPGIGFKQELKGQSNYLLRVANSCSDNKIRIPINTEYPILAYTPPFDTGTGIKSYCMLGEENVLDWFNKFKIKHYYIIYLEIK